MNKRHSMQWKLTLTTAFMVIISCLAISYFISKSAILYMGEIENSIIAILPAENFSEKSYDNIEVHLDPKAILSDTIKSTQTEFWTKSLLITLIITLISSSMMYFIIGGALRPLHRLSKQIEDIQAKNLQQLVVLNSNSSMFGVCWNWIRIKKRKKRVFLLNRSKIS